MIEEGTNLEIEFELNPNYYRRAWFHAVRKNLPSVLAFWGTIIFIGAVAIFYYRHWAREVVFFSLLVGIILAILSYIYFSSYRNFITETRKMDSIAGNRVRLVFSSNSDGFDFIQGKNFSHIAWESVTFYEEYNEYIILGYSNGFYIPKTAFQNESELSFLKSLVQIKSLALKGK
jgi:hypothetical protein